LVVIVTQFTTTSVPVAKSEETAGHVVFVKSVIEYVVVTVGETLNVYGLVVIPDTVVDVEFVPSFVVYVNVHGVGPVNATLISPDPPLQIGEVPVIIAVFLFTVTVAVVEISFGVAVHLESLNAVIE
jgi:hypothetical protein